MRATVSAHELVRLVEADRIPLVTMPMNCSGMYRGVVYEDGVPKTALFDDDELD